MIKLHRNTISPVVLYGRVTWSLALREERGLRVSENRFLRKKYGLNSDGVRGECKRHIRRNFEISILHQIKFGKSNKKE